MTRWTPVALLLAVSAVVVAALVAKVAVETLTRLDYEIHWTTSVPVLVLLVALVLNGQFGEDASSREAQ